jgi:hypothetical protein
VKFDFSGMSAAKRVRMIGTVFLVAGLVAAIILFCGARPDDLPTLGIDQYTKRDMLQLEKMGGKSYILFSGLNEWFVSLWHGRRLACTVGILSIVGFLGCRWFADLLARSQASDEHAPGKRRKRLTRR